MKDAVRRAPATCDAPAACRAPLATLAAAAALFGVPLAARSADLNAVNNAVSNAAHVASGAGASAAVPSLGAGAVLQTIFGLAVVIALVFACAWLARRFGFQSAARGTVIRTIGGVSLGGKERVAVVEIGDTWLVLGAAPGNVRLLHALPAGTDGGPGGGPGGTHAGDATLPGTFGSRFRAALAGEARKRFSRPSGGGK